MADAVYIGGGSAYDAIIVKDGIIPVFEGEILNDFLQGGDFDEWEAPWKWDEWEGVDFDEEFLFDAACDVAEHIGGKIVAYWDEGKLFVLDDALLQERVEFYGANVDLIYRKEGAKLA